MSGQRQIDDHIPEVYGLIQRGNLQDAETLCQKLVERFPREASAWSWLGCVMLMRKRLAGAESALRKAVELNPRDAGSWDNLGHAVSGQGRPQEAEAHSRRAIKLNPSVANYWVSLGAALADQERWQEARDACEQALSRNPQDPSGWVNLGDAEANLQHLAAAQQAYERGLSLAPNHPDIAIKYAFLLTNRGQPRRGIELVQGLTSRTPLSKPQMADAWLLLGYANKLLNNLNDAETACRQALPLAPVKEAILLELAHVLRLKMNLPEAEACLRRLLAQAPDHAEAWALLSMILHARSKTVEAISALRRSIGQKPTPYHRSKLLATLQYDEQSGPADLLSAHLEWNAIHGKPLFSGQPAVPRRADAEHLRLGFVSMDFGLHPTAHMVLPVLEHLDKTQCSLFFYSDRTIEEDAYTARFRAAAEGWRPIIGRTDEEVAEQIRSDRIDVLFDLMGHFGERLAVFARQPAPVQITWFGYVGTTGLSAMDFLLADRFHIPQGEEKWYSEKILRMPGDYACFAPPADAPPIGPLPAVTAGSVTFGCFNNSTKYSPTILNAWATILERIPSARLFLKFLWLGHAEVQKDLRGEFAKRGIDPDRIMIEGRSPHLEFLATYNRIDLALDTQPYSGGLTTCEALWMGVPVITFPGQTFAGRHSTSHLTNAGYPQFIAQDLDGYIDLAVSWANRLDELALIRSQMRDQVRQSPLCDAHRFAKDFLSLLQHAWHTHSQHQQLAPQPPNP